MQVARTRPDLKRRRRGHHLTAAAKAEYLDRIQSDFVAGLTVDEIATKNGISTASIYRWQRQSDEIQRSINAEDINHHFSIDNVLDSLCIGSIGNTSRTKEAIFQCLNWIRRPKNQDII